MYKLPKNSNPMSLFFGLRSELERAQSFLSQLKSLPNCYHCSGRLVDPNTLLPFCEYCIVDDGVPSRYNCPLFVALPYEDLKEDY